MIRHSAYCYERKSVPYATEGTGISLSVEIRIFGVKVVRFCRVHPPSVHAKLKDTFVQVIPINITSLRMIWIINLHARRIIKVRRPSFHTRFGPCSHIHQQPFLLKFLERFSLWTKRRPNGNHHVCIQAVDFINHPFRITVLVIQELHCIP